MRDIRYTVPRTYEKYIPAIVEKLKTRLYHWNEYGEMTENRVPFKGSKIVDLFSHVMRNSKRLETPQHLGKFMKAIIEINIPHSWLANKGVISKQKVPFLSFGDSEISQIEDDYRRISTPIRNPGERVFEREIEVPWKMRSQTEGKWIEN
ncbi:hypothetical protein AVEN_183768-1 [Araneus ventricosus]|uniref:Uncharacterized protein n=1 Tax=Araneus ventricosus TaxID=182803 RepID=A0A4Y2BVU6_ARAVE|nr:hypothetical protein AVEN_183768-1 [Araneus ventricosus]